MLLEDWIPEAKNFDRDKAISQLTKKYFLSRGPATLPDFAWWSGLNITDTRKGIEMNKELLAHEIINETKYWFSAHGKLSNP